TGRTSFRMTLSVAEPGERSRNGFAFELGGDVVRRTPALVVAVLCLSTTSLHAGPCSNAIAQFEQGLRQSASNPDAGPFARQSIGAQLDREPTPGSVARAEARAQANFKKVLARAKRLDAPGALADCTP